jgi:putative hemolysin
VRRIAGVAAVCLCLLAAFVGQSRAGRAAACLAISPSVLPQQSEKTQQHTVGLRLMNVSRQTCTLRGYPAVSFTTASGGPLPFAVRKDGDQMITGARPALVRLKPRASAYFAFNKNVCVRGSEGQAATLSFILPGGHGSRSVKIPRSAYIDYCAPPDPGHTISVSPVVARQAAAYCLKQGSCKRR